eukprot:TRINITY_DN2518_c0_g1_i1.p1 TRINITY_DN2518_c0_g1~~TRINITY_DN2518_c0_g1_i1.p1  ORF type:complete len:124 (-),score=28.71 TRINITY_DN2518_c0_g1_i1:151-522(-)
MGTVIEVKDKEAFYELQDRLMEQNRNLQQVKARIQMNTNEKKRSQFTLQEINTLPPSTRTYKAVGKAFILESIPSIKSEISKRIEKIDTEVTTLTNQTKYIERQILDTESGIKELIIVPGGRK